MTQFLPPNLLALFQARSPMPFMPPPSKKRINEQPYTGVSAYLNLFEVECLLLGEFLGTVNNLVGRKYSFSGALFCELVVISLWSKGGLRFFLIERQRKSCWQDKSRSNILISSIYLLIICILPCILIKTS